MVYVTDGDIQFSKRFFTDTAVWHTGKHDDQYSDGRGNMTISIYSNSLSKKLKSLPSWGG